MTFLLIAALAVAAAQPPAQKAESDRFRELRTKARDGTLTTTEKAELEKSLKAREWANRPKLPAAVVPPKNPDPPRSYYADNEKGSDANDGRTPAAAVKSLAKAVKFLKPGDTLHLAANAGPYRESLILMDVSGNPEQPITIDGHGATITGSDPLRTDWVSAGEPGLYKSEKLLDQLDEFGDDAKLGRVFFVFDGQQQRMNRTSKGKKAAFKKPADLTSGEWTFDPAAKTFYVKVAGTLEAAKVEAPYRRNGVTVRGRAGVSHVVVKNLNVRHVLNDGFNLHGVGTAIRFENIRATECGDDGCSPHETIACTIDGFRSTRNSTGVGLGNRAVTTITNAHFEGNFAFDFAVGHAPDTVLSNSVIHTTEPGAKPFGTINPQELKLTFDNVLVRVSAGGNFEVGPRSTFTAKRSTFLVPGFDVFGTAAVTECVVAGRAVAVKQGGAWKGVGNVYAPATKFVGFADPAALRKEPKDAAGAGANETLMKIPAAKP